MRYLAIIFSCISSLTQAQFVNNTGIIITNSANLYTNGDWQNTGPVRNDGKITTSESWQNNGTMDVNSTGGFVLNYGVNTAFSAGSNSSEVGFIEKNGAGAAILTGKLYVRDSLKISSGTIKVNTGADTLGLLSNPLLSIAPGSYVDGPMANKTSGPATIIFPTGRDGNYLPIKFYNSTSTRVGIAIEDAPVGYTAGDAVESVSAFPYAWRAVSAQPTDEGSYIEVQVPDALAAGITNPVVVQQVDLINEYEGMGSRLVSSDGLNTTIRSYSGAVRGLFTLANGYPGNLIGDSTELVAFFNAADGVNWNDKTNWTAGLVESWFGVTQNGGRVTRVNMPNNNINGPVPATLVNLNALRVFNIASNNVTTIPDFSSLPALTTLDVSENSLDFGSLESNASLLGVNYVNQAPVNAPLDIEIPVNTDYQIHIPVAGTSNVYKWKFKGQEIAGATADTYTIVGIKRATMGDYVMEITNPLVPGLVLTSSNQRVLATADIAGTLFVNSTTPASGGTMRLLKVTTAGSYDTTRVQDLNANGSYLFDNVILDDYLVNGFADTIAHPKAIPTYHENTIFWEEADTIFLEDNLTALNIFSQFKPDPPTTGEGIITGTFYSNDDAEGGRVERARVQKAAVTVRRVESSGKGNEELLTLVAYVFTNDNGEFTFNKLDAHEYRFNIQLPGYPMDATSFITIPVGNTLFDRQVGVEAEVIAGKINVKKLVITGWQEEDHSFYAYPNPTIEYLYLQGQENNQNTKFQLTDVSGRVMDVPADWNESGMRWELKISHLPFGTYFLHVLENGKLKTAQISIQ